MNYSASLFSSLFSSSPLEFVVSPVPVLYYAGVCWVVMAISNRKDLLGALCKDNKMKRLFSLRLVETAKQQEEEHLGPVSWRATTVK